MAKLKVSPDAEIFYTIDDFTDPWTQPETILLLHGNAESSAAWYAWVPQLARKYRVVRPDMRGHGASTPMPRDFPWTLDVLVEDYTRVMDDLGIERFHVVGAKIGGTIARAFAARRAKRVISLTVIGTPPPLRKGAETAIPEVVATFEKHGVETWARQNMGKRLGSRFPAEGAEWWTKFMGRTAVSTQIGFAKAIAYADIRADVARITCPLLVITNQGSAIASADENREWQQKIPNSSLLVLPGDSYHVAVTDAERCAQATLEFISRNRAA